MRIQDPDEWIEDDGELILINHSAPSERWVRTDTPIDLDEAQ